MSGMNRKITKNKNLEIMMNVFEEYKCRFNFDTYDNNYYKVSIQKINLNYFTCALELHTAYELFFEDLISMSEIKNKKLGIIEFLQDSVDNNYMLNDSLKKEKFKVKNDHIYTKINNNEVDMIHTGEFIIGNYRVNTCWSYMFFTNLITNEQFMYYGD